MTEDDDFLDKALEGFTMFALNQGEVCTCPSRALIQKSIYDRFMEKALARVAKIKQGHPLDPSTMVGAQASNDQLEKILSYIDIGTKEGARVLAGGERLMLEGELAEGYYVKPTIFEGSNRMRIFQEEIFGPVVSVTTFDTPEEALAVANDTLYGLGAGARGLRRLQAVRPRARDPQDDARPLSADEEHAGKLQPKGPRFFLIDKGFFWPSTEIAGTATAGPAIQEFHAWSNAYWRPRRRRI
jgi:acyl-CoA reductase-like NAD-dependent aldehyde dehydrogenase